MRLTCLLVRRSAAAYANNELRYGRLASFVRSHLESCADCANEVESFRTVGRLLASTRPAEANPRVQWDDVRRAILDRREAHRQRTAVLATVRRGASLAVVWGAAAVALWFVGPVLRSGLISDSAAGSGEMVRDPEHQPAPAVVEESTSTVPSVQEFSQSRLAESSVRDGHVRSVTPPIRIERVAVSPVPNLSASDMSAPEGPPQTIAVELSPNENTGAVEAAVVSPDEDSLLIDT